jgi:hypothetical protein
MVREIFRLTWFASAQSVREIQQWLDSLMGLGRSVHVICPRTGETAKRFWADRINCSIYGDIDQRGELTLEFIEGLSVDGADDVE